MQFKTRSIDNVTVIDLAGRFDKYAAPPVVETLEHLTAGPAPTVLVNMTQVNFVDSTGLATLVQGLKRAKQQGGDLYLCCMRQPVYMIFELTRLDKAFDIFVSEEHALKTFATLPTAQREVSPEASDSSPSQSHAQSNKLAGGKALS
jgi:anti-sigma B factor antagonist